MKQILVISLICLGSIAKAQHNSAKIDTKDTTVYTAVEQQPDFPGGLLALNKYIMKNLRYIPDSNNVQSRFIASFVVEKNGAITHLKIIRPQHTATEKLFAKVIQDSPRWHPAIQNGYIVRAKYTVPLTICLASEY